MQLVNLGIFSKRKKQVVGIDNMEDDRSRIHHTCAPSDIEGWPCTMREMCIGILLWQDFPRKVGRIG
jgi:hypothetical protein